MKPILTAAAREAARARAVEDAGFRQMIAEAQAAMNAAGWTNVVVQRKANFIAISGDDPAGVNHSGAMTDGQALADFLISIGIKPPFRRTTAQAVPNVRHTRAAVATAPGEDTDLVKSLRARISELESREPEIREVEKIVERVVEVPAAVVEAEAPVDSLGEELERTRRANRQMVNGEERSSIPAEIAELMEEGETLPQARRRLTELLFVEQAELKNLRGMAGEDLPREAQIEKLLGLFARLGEI